MRLSAWLYICLPPSWLVRDYNNPELLLVPAYNVPCYGLYKFAIRMRPLCTTLLRTIRPALMVLWGVCWLFYYGSLHSTSDIPVAGVLSAENLLDLNLAFEVLPLDLDLYVPEWSHSYEPSPSLAFDPTAFTISPANTITIATTAIIESFSPSQVQEHSVDEVYIASTDGPQKISSPDTTWTFFHYSGSIVYVIFIWVVLWRFLRDFYLLLQPDIIWVLSFSEFANGIRPSCTTMPWTIRPALMVLWGVCWMFYYGNLQSTSDVLELPVAGVSAENLLDLNLAFDFHFDLEFDVPEWSPPHETPPFRASDPAVFTVNPADTITRSSIAQVPNTPPATFLETQQTEVATTTILASSGLPQVQEHSLDQVHITSTDNPQNKPSKNTRHGQVEKYFCTYSDCKRSQPGSGFKRKDNRDQHLRTAHKQVLMERIRAPPVMASGFSTPASNTEVLLQSRKRKHREDEYSDLRDVEALQTELERVQQENLELRQKVMKYEERMERDEQRLDTLMSLFGQQNGSGAKIKEQ